MTPYGFPVEAFAPRTHPPTGRFTVLSVGTHDLRKGTPYLLEAWRRAAIPDAELHLVGPLRLAKSFVDRYAGSFRHWPHVPKSELGARYAAADLLIFPTLGDGFGLVIQEAMCSRNAGPHHAVRGRSRMHHRRGGRMDRPAARHRRAGRAACGAAPPNRDRVVEMGEAARARAERWTWRDAGRALVGALDL